MEATALVLAAGRGERFGSEFPKAFALLAGVPLIVRSLRALSAVAEIDRVVPVVSGGELERYAKLSLAGIPKLDDPVVGGASRQDSMAEGLARLSDSTRFVAVHDAARCLVDPADVRFVLRAGFEGGAAILAERVRDTIKRVRAGNIVETPDRSECWAAQTPQVFSLEVLREALAKAQAEGRQATDDAGLVEALGVRVRVVESQAPNPKITFVEDLAWAERWLLERGR